MFAGSITVRDAVVMGEVDTLGDLLEDAYGVERSNELRAHRVASVTPSNTP
jgi:hypothetical protein